MFYVIFSPGQESLPGYMHDKVFLQQTLQRFPENPNDSELCVNLSDFCDLHGLGCFWVIRNISQNTAGAAPAGLCSRFGPT